MLKKFGPGSDYYNESTTLELQRSVIKQERQNLLDSSIVRLPKSEEKNSDVLLMTALEKAQLRNKNLLKSIEKLNRDIEGRQSAVEKSDFLISKKNYWEMVNQLLPAWEKELEEYNERKRREKANREEDVV